MTDHYKIEIALSQFSSKESLIAIIRYLAEDSENRFPDIKFRGYIDSSGRNIIRSTKDIENLVEECIIGTPMNLEISNAKNIREIPSYYINLRVFWQYKNSIWEPDSRCDINIVIVVYSKAMNSSVVSEKIADILGKSMIIGEKDEWVWYSSPLEATDVIGHNLYAQIIKSSSASHTNIPFAFDRIALISGKSKLINTNFSK